MSRKIQRLVAEKNRAAQDTLERLRFKAPTVYQRLQEVMKAKRQALSGLGDFSFTDFLDLATSVKAAKEISGEERKQTELELEALREKNKAIEKQIRLETELQESKNRGLTLAQKANMAGGSIMDQLADKPWALPLAGGLLFALFRSIGSRRKGRR